MRRRYRQCTDPAALFGGKPCEGKASEHEECMPLGNCPFLTDYTELPYRLKKHLNKYLKKTNNSLVLAEKKTAYFVCNSSVKRDLDFFYKPPFKVDYNWTHNGDPFVSR